MGRETQWHLEKGETNEDLRIRKTRAAIQRAFILLIAEMDFNAISIAELMKKAGYSRGTFYLHFQNIWEVYEQTVKEYAEELCRCFEVEKRPGCTMEEGSMLLELEVLQVVKRWYPFGKALLNRRSVPDIFLDAIREYAETVDWKTTVLFPTAGLRYVALENGVAREMILRYAVTTVQVMFECAARYVTPSMTWEDERRLLDGIHAGNVGWVGYEQQLDLHGMKWNGVLAEKSKAK